jgi:hypothetical protein
MTIKEDPLLPACIGGAGGAALLAEEAQHRLVEGGGIPQEGEGPGAARPGSSLRCIRVRLITFINRLWRGQQQDRACAARVPLIGRFWRQFRRRRHLRGERQ